MAGAKSLGLAEILVSTCIKTEVYLFKVRESLKTEFLIRQPANSVSLEIKLPQASRVLVRGYANSYPPQLPGLEKKKRIACFHSLEFKSPRLIIQNSKPDVLIFWGAVRWPDFQLPVGLQLIVFEASRGMLAVQEDVVFVDLESSTPTEESPQVEDCPDRLKVSLKALEELLIAPALNRDLFKSFGIESAPRVLIHGTGDKSELIRMVILRIGKTRVFRIAVSVLFGKDLGSTERRIQKVFEMARNQAPCLLVLEDIHLLVSLKEDDEGLTGTFSRALAALLTGLDGVDANKEDMSVVATSSVPPHALEPAIVRPGRLESWIEVE